MVTPDLTLSSKVRKLVAPAALGFVCLLLYHSWATNSTTYHSLQAPALALIPKKIWYKLGPTGLSYKARNWTGTCAPRNPGYVAELLTNETSESWVRTVYASRRPDFVEGYLAAPGPNPQGRSSCGTHSSSPRAASGPTPSTTATPASSSAGEFDADPGRGRPPPAQQLDDTGEAGAAKHDGWRSRASCRALHDVAAENHVAISNVALSMVEDVVDFTGPRRRTKSVFKALRHTFNSTDEDIRSVEASTWFITEPKLVADVLVLPGFAFASSTNTYENTDIVGLALVTHHYTGSWTNGHGGEEV